MSTRRVLVIGGTGFLGLRIAQELVRQGDQVAVLARGLRAADELNGVERLQADRHDPAALRTVLGDRTFDAVVDNVAFDAEDVSATLGVLDGRAGHYLLTSSSAVYTERYTRRPIQEHQADLTHRAIVDGPNPFHPRLGHAYANGKRTAEQAAHQSAIPWTVLRPPVILGADDRTHRVWWLVQRLMDGRPLLIPDWGPGRVFQVAWAHDVSRAFSHAAANPAAFGRAYNVAQAELYTAESWIEAAAALLGVPARYAHIAEDALGPAGLAGYTLPVAGRPFGHMLLDIGAIRGDLGFEPSPESVWLQETLQGCAANPPAVSSAGYERRDEEARLAEALCD